MDLNHKSILENANAAINAGNLEGFLAFCTEDTEWTFVGEVTLRGKEQVRQYMSKSSQEPPDFKVDYMIEEGEFVTAVGSIRMKNVDGTLSDYAYCDVWRFRENQMAELKAFVIKKEGN